MKLKSRIKRLIIEDLSLFKIFLADMLFIVNSTDVANYADGNTPYATANDIDSLIASLREALKSLVYLV